MGSQAHPGGEPRSRGLGAVGQGLAEEGCRQEQDAGGTPALPGAAFRLRRRGVSGGRLLRNLDVYPWGAPICIDNALV